MAKKRKRTKSKKAFKLKLKKATIYSIVQIAFFSLAGLIIISFARQGLVLVKLNDTLVGYFSWTTIFLPFIFIVFGLILTKIKTPLNQPNVVVGILLFFVSLLTISRAGIVGRSSWEGVATLITPFGAFIILTGTVIVGLIVLFNTSVDQVLIFISRFLLATRRYLLGERTLVKKPFPRKELKVLGGSLNVSASPRASQTTP